MQIHIANPRIAFLAMLLSSVSIAGSPAQRTLVFQPGASDYHGSIDTQESHLDFPSRHYPSGPHPRLWLTQERLVAFARARAIGTPQWSEFQQICDSLVDDNDNNDGIWNLGHWPQLGAAPLALMYRITGDPIYAARALELMEATPVDVRDHANFHYFALAYDWLYDYPGMSDLQRLGFRRKIVAISDRFWQEYNGGGAQVANGDTDLNLETGMIHLISGAAIFGEDQRALELLERG